MCVCRVVCVLSRVPVYAATSPDSPAPVSAPRMLVHAGSGALGSLVEEWVGAAPAAPAPAAGANTCDGFTCPVCEIFLEKNAQVCVQRIRVS